MSPTIRDLDIDLQSTGEKHTQEFLSREKCSGVMGVPITFLAKYNPEQFEILGLANSARYIGDFPCYTVIGGIKIYNRILIKRRRDNEH
ncbi:MAG: adenine-specific methyltransferase EcoRI family protein [Acutalibacteraceae bacterium]